MPKIAEIESTPNPNAYRFVLKDRLTWGMPRSFANAGAATNDPLASQLFEISGVSNVYYVDTWITVTQDGSRSWPELLKELAPPIRSAPVAEKPDNKEDIVSSGDDELDDNSDPRLAEIRQLLNDRVRPALMGDGGDLQIVSLIGNTLTVRYFGACGSCPSSLSGTLNAIQNLVETVDPEIKVVVI